MVKSQYFNLIILIILSISCQNKNIEDLKSGSELQEILINHKNKLIEIDKQYNVNGQKEILNQLLKNNGFLSHKNYKSTLESIENAKKYFDTIFKKNGIVFKNTLDRIDKIDKKNLDDKQKNEIIDAQTSISLVDSNSTIYYINMTLLLSKLYDTVYEVEQCKHIVENNEVLFYDNECLKKYNKLVSEVQKLQVKCNNIKAKYNEFY